MESPVAGRKADFFWFAVGATMLALMAIGLGVATPRAIAQADPNTARIVVVPDTQNYTNSEPSSEIVQALYQWIADQAPSSNTVFVTAVGDVVEHASSTTEWDRIEPGFESLEAASVPYGIAPGNHDLVVGGADVEFDRRFGPERFADQPWYGGYFAPEGNRASFQTLSVPGHELLFVHVRHLLDTFGSVEPALDWVDQVLAEHPNHLAFVSTHEFTNAHGNTVMASLRAVVENHCNVAAIFSGHLGGEAGHGEFRDECDRPVHHLLTNYQSLDNGGDGFVKTLDIDLLNLETQVQVYSPTLDEHRVGVDEQFSMTLAKLEPVPGDANCDRTRDVLDAMEIAQYAVAVRTAYQGCPRALPNSQIDLVGADADGSGSVDILDALQIAQCSVGIPNPACPAP